MEIYVKQMARDVKWYNSQTAIVRSSRTAMSSQEANPTMLSFLRSPESKDFDKAMDFLECSRTLMSSAIETHRAIEEISGHDVTELLMLVGIVRHADNFLKNNLESISRKLETWKLQMQLQEPERFRKIERIVQNAEKNMKFARQKAIHIDHWVRFDQTTKHGLANR